MLSHGKPLGSKTSSEVHLQLGGTRESTGPGEENLAVGMRVKEEEEIYSKPQATHPHQYWVGEINS